MSLVSGIECTGCGKKYDPKAGVRLCSDCGKPLHIAYDLNRMRETLTTKQMESRTPGIWKYHELLPVYDLTNVVSLGEGGTYLLKSQRLAQELDTKISS